jgi:ribosomal protein S18 acetylase RimI-like enzyme
LIVLIRDYVPADEESWLRCRLLSFLHTSYYDDVVPARPTLAHPSIQLVTASADVIVGVLDVTIDNTLATIDTIAVHPDNARRGTATALLAEALDRLPGCGVETLDAWTREDVAANAWYQANHFTEEFRYIHVHTRGKEETAHAVSGRAEGQVPLSVFVHVPIDQEDTLRAQYKRVYICRRYVRPIAAQVSD